MIRYIQNKPSHQKVVHTENPYRRHIGVIHQLNTDTFSHHNTLTSCLSSLLRQNFVQKLAINSIEELGYNLRGAHKEFLAIFTFSLYFRSGVLRTKPYKLPIILEHNTYLRA
jgi:hypothetical protein